MSDGEPRVRTAELVGSLPRAEWDALAGTDNPFVSYDFLTALEESGSVGPEAGWLPLPIVVERGPDHRLAAAMPAYVKSHSQGEYVFDHAWADAYERAGGAYYPKLQIAVPFTPATGPRLLAATPGDAEVLLRAAEWVCGHFKLSSAHATFIEPAQRAVRVSRAVDSAGRCASDLTPVRSRPAHRSLPSLNRAGVLCPVLEVGGDLWMASEFFEARAHACARGGRRTARRGGSRPGPESNRCRSSAASRIAAGRSV